jgi:MFS family permease
MPTRRHDDFAPKIALRFVIVLGVVSLFADMTYEGARSITGPFLGLLGASGTAVGVVAGLGELIGYALRLVSGYLSDRTRQYWGFTFVGYVVNLLAVPVLALAARWEIAGGLIVIERIGKAVRTPARDAMLSHAGAVVGRGWGFGLHEALDQVGAVVGPLFVAAVLYAGGGYRAGFACLLVPAIVCLGVRTAARLLYPRPKDLEPTSAGLSPEGLKREFWIYMSAVALIAAGFADFALIAFHLARAGGVPQQWIPILYALAMAVDALAALVFGRLYDRVGRRALVLAAFLSAWFAPLVFMGSVGAALVGIVLWGIGMGAQESILRAAVAGMVAADRRASAFGVFNAGYGIAWFLGSALMGVLYDLSLPALVGFSVAVQLAALPLLLLIRRLNAAS